MESSPRGPGMKSGPVNFGSRVFCFYRAVPRRAREVRLPVACRVGPHGTRRIQLRLQRAARYFGNHLNSPECNGAQSEPCAAKKTGAISGARVMAMRHRTKTDFEVRTSDAAVEAIFKPMRSRHTFDRDAHRRPRKFFRICNSIRYELIERRYLSTSDSQRLREEAQKPRSRSPR
jgi:hypothetical protein